MRAIMAKVVRLPWLWLAPTLGAALALAFIGLGAAFTSRAGDLWFELAKTGMLLLAVEVLGGAVAAAYRALDDRREERRRIDDYLASLAGELIDAYHRIKAVRRRLRALGLRSPASGTLSAEEYAVLQAQMDTLIDAQLALEKVMREVEEQPPLFRPHHAAIMESVDGAQSYVNDVIEDWEDHGKRLQVDADLASVMPSLEQLEAFLGGAKGDEGLKENASKPIVESALLIHSLRLRVGG
jgi:hypothetical protein